MTAPQLNPWELAYLRGTSVEEATAFLARNGPAYIKRRHPHYCVWRFREPGTKGRHGWHERVGPPMRLFKGIRGMREWQKVRGRG